jgi:8-oxo-dGTP diphosphatase
MSDPGPVAEVEAAGAVVWRKVPGGGVLVAVVHRPRYDDWSFPKGKLDADETHEEAAVREVAEETGLTVRLGEELPPVRYTDHRGRTKRVRWWEAECTGDPGVFAANDEVDVLEWVEPAAVVPRLSYHRDRDLLAAAVAAIT